MPIPFTPPMECLPVKNLPDGPEWVYELKLDGYRTQAIREADGVRLLSRNGKDLGRRFPRVVEALAHAIRPNTVIDGELVAMDADGRSSFQALQNAQPHTPVTFYAFDILMDNGNDVRGLPLRQRHTHLHAAFRTGGPALLCENFPGPADKSVAAVRQLGGEGVVAKHLDSPYEEEGKRSGAWRKMRLNLGQEFVIGGYTPGSNGFDAVIVGYYKPAPPLTLPNAQGFPHAVASTLLNLRSSYMSPGFVLALSRRAVAPCFLSWNAAASIDVLLRTFPNPALGDGDKD